MVKRGNAKSRTKYMRDWKKTRLLFDPLYFRTARLKSRYGITMDDYANMLADQDGVCAICGYAPSSDKKALMVDHDHKTGNIRGLLCIHCNTGIAYLKDDIGVLGKAADYLQTAKSHSMIKNILKGIGYNYEPKKTN